MRCPYCSAELAEDAVFCPYCMSPLKEKTKIPPLYGKRRAAGIWALCLFSLLLAAGSLFFLTRTRAPGQAPLPGPAGSASLNAAETTYKTAEDPSSPPAGTAAPATEPPAEETEASAGTLPAHTEPAHTETAHTRHTAVTDPAVAPTCTGTGLTEGSHCSVCGEVLTAQKTVPAAGHKAVTDAAVAPTCTQTGLTEGSHCSVCGEVFTAQKTVAVTEHVYKEATYSSPAVCIYCGRTKGTSLPEPHIYLYYSKATLPRYSSAVSQIRVDDVEWETVYNGDGTYKVKVFLTVINRRSSSIISGVPCYLGGVESDLIYPKELIPGETVRVESVFSSVPGGSYTLTF